MKLLYWFGAALLVGGLAPACSDENGCGQAANDIIAATKAICAEPAFDSSAFCTVCVAAGYYSTTGPADCRCRLLRFDQPYCTSPGDDETRSMVRGAIAWAAESCPKVTISAADAGADSDAAPSDDAGTGGQ